jgi:hypothetical protein
MEWIIALILPNILFILFLFFFATLYPDVLLSREGIKYRTYLGRKKKILWNEIESLCKLSKPKFFKEHYIITIDREGYLPPINYKGLFFESLLGSALTVFSPLIVISPITFTKDEIEFIKSRIYSWKDNTFEN